MSFWNKNLPAILCPQPKINEDEFARYVFFNNILTTILFLLKKLIQKRHNFSFLGILLFLYNLKSIITRCGNIWILEIINFLEKTLKERLGLLDALYVEVFYTKKTNYTIGNLFEQESHIVRMTTTCASRYHGIIKDLFLKIFLAILNN